MADEWWRICPRRVPAGMRRPRTRSKRQKSRRRALSDPEVRVRGSLARRTSRSFFVPDGPRSFCPHSSQLCARIVGVKPIDSAESSGTGQHPLQRFSHGWRALRHRNFRLFFTGQSISLIGTWMTRVATSWLIYRLTGSALLLGVVSFAGQIPTFVLAPFAGVLVDRLNRRKMLVWTQALAGMQSLALAALTLAKVINVHEVLWLSVLQGLINAFDMPGRQAFLVQMVEDKQDLGNAIALNSSMVNMARLIGPALAGIVIGSVGEGYCFLIDGLSYLPVIASLLMMRLKPWLLPHGTASMFQQLKEGWEYVARSTPIRTILLLFAMVSLMGWPFTVLMPVFALKILNGGPHTYGFLMGAVGIGALISAYSLAVRPSVRGLTKMIPISSGLFGAALILFGLSKNFWFSLIVLLFCFFFKQKTAYEMPK